MMKFGQVVVALIVSVAIFFLGYYLGKNSLELGEPEITTEISITESSGALTLEPVKIELKNGSVVTDTVTIYQLEKIPSEKDTAAVYNDYYTTRTYNRAYGTDSTYTLTLTSIVQNNRIVREEYSDSYREKTRVEKTPYLSTPTKLGISVNFPFKMEWLEVKGHLLLKQKIDLSIGYNSLHKLTGGIAYYF